MISYRKGRQKGGGDEHFFPSHPFLTFACPSPSFLFFSIVCLPFLVYSYPPERHRELLKKKEQNSKKVNPAQKKEKRQRQIGRGCQEAARQPASQAADGASQVCADGRKEGTDKREEKRKR
mmetsp:Transcript_13557/g.26906  ORF Transcript_13557/g.26906 Transcript_13557/m.26906 type:complete len:121 (+) Transcript_13557:140-502(+)